MAAPTAECNALETYRKRASFDTEALKLQIMGEEAVEYEKCVSDVLRSDPLFSTPPGFLSMDEKRRLTVARMKRLHEYDLLPEEDFYACPVKSVVCHRLMMAVDCSVDVAFSLNGVRMVYMYHNECVTSSYFVRGSAIYWNQCSAL